MIETKVLYNEKTPFNDITVKQRGSILTLWSSEETKQSEIDLAYPSRPWLEYTKSIVMALAFCQNPSSILILGLGGGSIAMTMAHTLPKCHIDIVEIDQVMLDVAKNYFTFTESDTVRVTIDDAANYVSKTDKTYDIIIHDAYKGDAIPNELTSYGFLKKLSQMINNEGVLAANLMTGSEVRYAAQKLRIAHFFQYMWFIHGDISRNTVVFALNRHIDKFTLDLNSELLNVCLPFPLRTAAMASRLQGPESSSVFKIGDTLS